MVRFHVSIFMYSIAIHKDTHVKAYHITKITAVLKKRQYAVKFRFLCWLFWYW